MLKWSYPMVTGVKAEVQAEGELDNNLMEQVKEPGPIED
jgi:hypothetical protein